MCILIWIIIKKIYLFIIFWSSINRFYNLFILLFILLFFSFDIKITISIQHLFYLPYIFLIFLDAIWFYTFYRYTHSCIWTRSNPRRVHPFVDFLFKSFSKSHESLAEPVAFIIYLSLLTFVGKTDCSRSLIYDTFPWDNKKKRDQVGTGRKRSPYEWLTVVFHLRMPRELWVRCIIQRTFIRDLA